MVQNDLEHAKTERRLVALATSDNTWTDISAGSCSSNDRGIGVVIVLTILRYEVVGIPF